MKKKNFILTCAVTCGLIALFSFKSAPKESEAVFDGTCCPQSAATCVINDIVEANYYYKSAGRCNEVEDPEQ